MLRILVAAVLSVLLLAAPAQAGLEFNSTSDRLTNAGFTVPTSAGTICFDAYPNWVKTDNAPHEFFSIRSAPADSNVFHIQKFQDNVLYAGWTNPTDHRVSIASASYTLNQSQWNAFCLTWDDTANETKLYINGSQAGTTSTSLATWNTSAETWHIGNIRSDQGNYNFNGRLAEFAIWSRVLTGPELTDRMSGRISNCISTGLIHYWALASTANLTDEAGTEDLTNANVTNAANHPTTVACAGGGGATGGVLLRGAGK